MVAYYREILLGVSHSLINVEQLKKIFLTASNMVEPNRSQYIQAISELLLQKEPISDEAILPKQ